MELNLEIAKKELCQDLSSRWLTLSDQVRQQSISLKSRTVGTALNAEATTLADDSEKLCAHFERLHGDVEKLLEILGIEEDLPTETHLDPTLPEDASRLIISQDHDHQISDNLKDVVKALFMWRDTPAPTPKALD